MHNLFEHVSKGSPISIRVGVVYTNGFNSQGLRNEAKKEHEYFFGKKSLKSQLPASEVSFLASLLRDKSHDFLLKIVGFETFFSKLESYFAKRIFFKPLLSSVTSPYLLGVSSPFCIIR
jgi:hypothetical protein